MLHGHWLYAAASDEREDQASAIATPSARRVDIIGAAPGQGAVVTVRHPVVQAATCG
jgi:hypothetical protein